MDIGAYSMANAQMKLANNVGIAVTKMSMDAMKKQTAEITEMIKDAAPAVAVSSKNSGSTIDITV